MPLGKAREPQSVETTGPGLMQEVKEEKSGEAGKESDRKGRQRVSQSRGDSEKLPPEGNRKAAPAPHPPSLCLRPGWAEPTGHHGLWACLSKGAGPQTLPVCPLSSARESRLGRPAGSSEPSRGLCTLSHLPGHTHSEPDESSSTVPALMLMAMGMTPFSCSWRLCRGGGRGGSPPRLPSLAEEPREDPVPCSRGSRRRLLFSLMVGRHFFLRMPVGQEGRYHEKQEVEARGCPREPHWPPVRREAVHSPL